ncbi:MAG: recQ, partial [Clostridia bacterium]|nr:recQ [Clostridia bacterium]
RIRDIINFLVLGDYVEITNDEYPVAKLGKNASSVLFNGEKLQMKLIKETEEEVVKATTIKSKKLILNEKELNSGLFERLKELRLSIATQQKVPAFVIFSDASLIDMCSKLPKNDDEFLQISGVGQIKLERYGNQFIKEITDYLKDDKSTEKTVTKVEISNEYDYEELLEYMNGQINNINFSDEPIQISVFCDIINSVLILKYINKLNVIKVTNWLTENGYLQILTDDEGKNYKAPTQKGFDTGISVIQKQGKDGKFYKSIHYNKSAQEFLFSNLKELLMKK